MWSLNLYRFGELRSTSVSPHGAWTHPPLACSGSQSRRSLSGGRRLVGRLSRWNPTQGSGHSIGFEGLPEEMLRQFDGKSSAAAKRSRPMRCYVAPSSWTCQAATLVVAWRLLTKGGAGGALSCRRPCFASKAATWLILPVVICFSLKD